ncbi:MAG: glycosyltransferase family 1 protein [Bacteroidetes bacterium]|nr:MAG: glycosyltransferase family 1 protein [Bacteroidota bacterium]
METQRLKLGIVGSVGVPAKYGGFETLVHHLVLQLGREFDLTVYCSGKNYPPEERTLTWHGARLHYMPFQANGLQSILYDLACMVHALRRCDALLVLGVSGCLFLPLLKLFSRKKIAVNIDGLEWRRPKWNWLAKRFLMLSEKIACRYADEIVTDNQILKEYVKIRYDISGNLIEYGADHVRQVPVSKEALKEYPFLNQGYAFKVARIEPENHLHTILEAFAPLKEQPLVIVGNWNNSAYGRKLREHYSRYPHLFLLDPIYDGKKLDLLRSNCKFYVHGHSAGGTNPSLVEAMYLGLPVVAYDVIYNRVTTNNQAVFFTNARDLKTIAANIDKYPLRAIARDLKAFADRKYTWQSVSRRYAELVQGMVHGKAPVFELEPVTLEVDEAVVGYQPGFHIQLEEKLPAHQVGDSKQEHAGKRRA